MKASAQIFLFLAWVTFPLDSFLASINIYNKINILYGQKIGKYCILYALLRVIVNISIQNNQRGHEIRESLTLFSPVH